jgi:hypothetical protein
MCHEIDPGAFEHAQFVKCGQALLPLPVDGQVCIERNTTRSDMGLSDLIAEVGSIDRKKVDS